PVDRYHRDGGLAAARSGDAKPGTRRSGCRSRSVDAFGHCGHADYGTVDVFDRRSRVSLQSIVPVQDGVSDSGPTPALHAASAGSSTGRSSDRGKAGGWNVPSPLDRGGGRRPDDRLHLSPFMTIQTGLEWIESTALSIAIREGGLPYPIIGGIHLLAIAWFGGMLLTTALRLLGWVMPQRRFSELWRQLQPWKRLGFVTVVVTGLLLTWAEPVRLYGSPSFWVKMSFFALVGVHALVFRAKVYGHPERLDEGI